MTAKRNDAEQMTKKMKWNADLYDQKHAFVFKFGEDVLDLLDVKPGEHILDIGCGTGHLTKQIQDKGAIVKGTDYSPDMIAQARPCFPMLISRLRTLPIFIPKKSTTPYSATRPYTGY